MSGNGVTPASCPLFPSKQTFDNASGTSAKCHKQTSRLTLLALGVGNGRDPFATPLDQNDPLNA
jgi:hypothetical protein